MELELEGNSTVVTGASKGIGFSIVQALTREGARVVAAARGESPALAEPARTGPRPAPRQRTGR